MTSPGYRRDRGDEAEDGNIQCHFRGRIIIIEAAGPARLSIFAIGPFFKLFCQLTNGERHKEEPV